MDQVNGIPAFNDIEHPIDTTAGIQTRHRMAIAMQWEYIFAYAVTSNLSRKGVSGKFGAIHIDEVGQSGYKKDKA